jgi:hypothetical protein
MCGKIVVGIAKDWVWRWCKTESKDTFSAKTVAVKTICIMMYDDNLENSTTFWEDTGEVKVKFTLEQAKKAQRGSRCCTLSLTLTLDGVGGQRHVPSS